MAQQSPRSDHGYCAYGELSLFVYCLLQKIKTGGSLLIVERLENYLLPNHSLFAPIEEGNFLVGTRVHAALVKMTSYHLKNEFRNSSHRFFEEFTSTVLSTFAARSKLGQGVSCFCLEIIIGAMTIPHSFPSDHSWTDWLRVAGRKNQTLKLAKLNFNLLSGISASESAMPAGGTQITAMSWAT